MALVTLKAPTPLKLLVMIDVQLAIGVATLVVVSNDAYLKNVQKVGNAPLEKAPAEAAMHQKPHHTHRVPK